MRISTHRKFRSTPSQIIRTSQPIKVRKFIADVKNRLARNSDFKIIDQDRYGLIAVHKQTKWLIHFKTTFHQNRNWAVLTVKWSSNEPGLQNLDTIKDAFFGDIYTIIHLHMNTNPQEALIIHCLEDKIGPGGNGE